ncbi:Signal transduction histidine kinase [Rathayibacter oskolensis]|uniref:histidine kinase n=1 Tax=Rathayibacter oskolensis TaxID=1891671 RepID=A0A1X7MX25_9MICO|nr:histidine kinase [Rathayibacter oskolensis]SMH29441.1 Signal transduction histidine kinase [Rathayibacter oskolensis]
MPLTPPATLTTPAPDTAAWLDRRSAGPILLAANLAVGLAIFALVAPRLPLWNLLLTLAIGLGAILPLGAQRSRPRTAGVAACIGAALTPIATPALWTALVIIGLRLPPRTAARFVAAGAVADAVLLTLFILRWARPETLGASILVGLFSVVVTVTIGVLGILAGAKRRSERDARERESTAVARSLDAERERIAEEIHDSLGHSLTLLSLHSAALRDLDGLTPEEIRALTESINRQTRAAVDSLTATLRAAPAAGSTEAAAGLDRLFSDVTETGRELEVRIEGDPAALDEAATAMLVRFCREGLTNALKHAAPGPLGVAVRIDGDGSVAAVVTSPGGAADPSPASSSRGVRALGDSAAELGGEAVLSVADDQSVLSLRLPAPSSR